MKVLVASYAPAATWTIPDEEVAWLRAQEPSVEFLHATDDASLRAALPEVEVAFSWKLTGELVALAPALKWVHAPNTGVREQINPVLAERGIVLTNSRGVDARPIAEHVLALTLALSRKLPLAVHRQAERTWAQAELAASPPGVLEGRTLGLLGVGCIGAEVARLAGPLFARVIAVRRRPGKAPPAHVDEVRGPEQLPWLLEHADVLVLAAPSTAATRAVLDGPALARLKPTALLVNVSRGDLLDEAALVAALREGRLAGAALDVTATEPLPATSPLWQLPSVLLTPHVAAVVAGDWHARTVLFLDNLRRYVKGEPLENRVDLDQGY